MILLIIILLIFVGFIALYFGSKLVIISLENIANRLGISHLLVGLTILAIGTSLPEIAISVTGGIDKLAGINSNIDGIIVGNKIDSPLANENVKELKKKFGDKLTLISTLTGEGLDHLKEKIWESSNLIRIYTDKSKDAIVLKKGVTVEALVKSIHKKLLEGFKEAIINGSSAKFPNQKVGLRHVLEDEDRVRIVSRS